MRLLGAAIGAGPAYSLEPMVDQQVQRRPTLSRGGRQTRARAADIPDDLADDSIPLPDSRPDNGSGLMASTMTGVASDRTIARIDRRQHPRLDRDTWRCPSAPRSIKSSPR